MDVILILLVIAGIVAFFTVWGVGAADLANILSTTLGSKAVSVRTAIIIAIIFEFAGAMFGGQNVSYTLQHQIINLTQISDPHIIIYALLSISFAAASWMLIASMSGLPASITNSIVGALVGFGWFTFGIDAINWKKILGIALSWVISPVAAGLVAYLIFANIQRLILMRAHPDRYVERYFPLYCFVIGMIFSQMIILKILLRFHYFPEPIYKMALPIICGVFFSVLGIYLGRRQHLPHPNDRQSAFAYVEKKFSILMGFTACAMVFAHGSNDVPIAVSPFKIIVNTLSTETHHILIPYINRYTLSLGSLGVIIGLLTYGRKVIATVGSGITTLTPSRAFAATFATACTVIFSTSAGIPISVTQALVGGVLGVGLARGIGALNLNVVRNIFMSWLITIPATSLLAILYYYIISHFSAVF
jgi:PiT family inorganic phosphate transporter